MMIRTKPIKKRKPGLSQKRFVVALFLILLSSISQSQNNTSDIIEQVAEKYSGTTSEAIDLTDQLADPEQLLTDPVNLNHASIEELRQLPFLNEIQVCNLYLYLQAYGTIYSPFEILSVEGFDSITLKSILPFIRTDDHSVRDESLFRNIFRYRKGEFIFRYGQVLQKQKGYIHNDNSSSATYFGSPQSYLFRLKYSFSDKLSLGFTGEKDPGEQFFQGNQPYGMDFYSGYVAGKNLGFVKSLVIGSFRAGFGQGLIVGNGFSLGSVPGNVNYRRGPGSVRPALSATENGFLRGIATTIRIKNFEISGFYSGHKTDANSIQIDSLTGETSSMSSLNGTGYHRLPAEIEDRNVVRERIAGGNINFRKDLFSIGITGIYSHWSGSLEPRSYPYNRFSIRGKENFVVGMDFQMVLRNLYLFGEAGRSRNGGVAILLGAEFSPHERMSFSLLLRDYLRSFQNLNGNAVGRNSTNSNEKGVIFAFAVRPFTRLTFSGFVDLFEFPWLKYEVDFPSSGNEFQVRSDYSVSQEVMMNLRFRWYERMKNGNENEHFSTLENQETISLRYQLDWKISPEFQLRNRFEFMENRFEHAENRYGYLISQGIIMKQLIRPVSLSANYLLFDSQTYDERIYIYEQDVLYNFYIPAFYGKGIRFSVLADWSPVRWLTFWVKFGHTWYSDREIIGTGPEEIEGNDRSDLTFQIRVRF